MMYIILNPKAPKHASIREVFLGESTDREEAAMMAYLMEGELFEVDDSVVAKIRSALAQEEQLVESLRTGLSRRVRGVK